MAEVVDCPLCHSKEHEHVRRGESCAERLVEQRHQWQMAAYSVIAAAIGMMVTYASVILLFFR